jgi:hypothetical protein
MEDHKKKEKTHDQKVRHQALKTLGWIFLAVLFAVNTFQLSMLGGIVERVDEYNKGVIDELGGIRQDVMSYGNDLNEIRSFLLLPVKEYSFMKGPVETQDTEEKQTTRTESALYAFLGGVTEEQSVKANTARAESNAAALLGDADFAAGLEKSGLKIGKREDGPDSISVKIEDGSATAVYALVFEKKTSATLVQSAIGSYKAKASEMTALKTELLDYLGKNKEAALKMKTLIQQRKDEVAALAADAGISASLKEKKMKMTPAEEVADTINYYFENDAGDRLMTLKIQRTDGTYDLDGTKINDAAGLLTAVTDKLKNADASTTQEKMLKERKAELEGIFAQKTFTDILSNDGLKIAAAPREEYNKILYDVQDAGGKTVFSFAIELSSGSFKVIKDNQETDLYSILDSGSKKKP